jgi:hypothetical protein
MSKIEFDDAAEDFEDHLKNIGSAYIGLNKEVNRYKDFQKTFKGPSGRRVLHEIYTWGHMYESSIRRARPIDPYDTHKNEGHRELALKLKSVMMKKPEEPKSKPTRTVRKHNG